MINDKSLMLKGINYDTGTNYVEGYISRELWTPELIEQEIAVIHDELHCNAINIFGSDIERLRDCASVALAQGLEVWLQPRLIDSTPQAMLAHLAELATVAEDLRQQYPSNVTLNLGCELSIFMHGLIPGKTFLHRARWLGYMWWLWMLLPRYNGRLNQHLKQALTIARSRFNGQITYGSGSWESVDWNDFDLIGVNFYRERYNQSTYLYELRQFMAHNKPLVITEFGCCSFDGADKLGGGGDSIVDYTKPMPELRGMYKRNEQVQADYIVDLLKLYQSEGVHGAFVFEFTEPSHPHTHDPRHDLDIASYGIVKVSSPDDEASPTTPNDTLNWERKQAFHALARFYETN